MKRLLVLVGMAAVLVTSAACGGPTVGQPIAGDTGSQSTTGGSPTSTAPSSSGGGSLPVAHPCDLVSSSDLQQVGVTGQPTEDNSGGGPTCGFDSDDFSMDLVVRTNLGLAQFQASGGTVQTKTVGGHQAKEVTDNTGSCVIGIGVTASSRVDVTVNPIAGGSPCPVAEKLATLIEPKLP